MLVFGLDRLVTMETREAETSLTAHYTSNLLWLEIGMIESVRPKMIPFVHGETSANSVAGQQGTLQPT